MDATLLACRPAPARRRPLLWAYQTVAFYLVLGAVGVVFLGWNLPATLCHAALPRARSERLGQAMIMHGVRALLGLVRLTGLAEFDLCALDSLRGERGVIIAPNHPTLLDALLVASRLPRVACITKASLWDNPALGAGARLAGYIRNDAPLRLVRRAHAALLGGAQLLIFPEGTRTAMPPVGPFKPGFALMAVSARAPVQIVILESSSPYLGKGWHILRRPSFPLHYRARLGARFAPEGPTTALAARIEASMRAELQAA